MTPPEATGPGPRQPPTLDDLRAFREARPFLIRTTAGERYPVRRPEEIMIPHEADSLVLFSPPSMFAQIELSDIAEVRAIAPDDPEAIEPAPPAEVAIRDRRGPRTDAGAVRGRLDALEDAVRHALRPDLRELRGEFRDLAGEVRRVEGDLVRLKFVAKAQGWVLAVVAIVLGLALARSSFR